MNEKLDLNFLKKVQRSVEPQINPGETALEAIKRMEAERVASMIQNPAPQPPTPPPAQEVVFYNGQKFSRDFFTCIALCIMKLNNPEINEILSTFGFTMKDLDGQPVTFKKLKKAKKKK